MKMTLGVNRSGDHRGSIVRVRGMNGRTPLQAFAEGLPKPTEHKEVTTATTQPKLKAA